MLADFAAEIAAGHVVVIEVARAVEGYLISWPKMEAYFIDNIAVDPAHQGLGLGRQLMEYAVREAKRHNLSAIQLYTNATMKENSRNIIFCGSTDHAADAPLAYMMKSCQLGSVNCIECRQPKRHGRIPNWSGSASGWATSGSREPNRPAAEFDAVKRRAPALAGQDRKGAGQGAGSDDVAGCERRIDWIAREQADEMAQRRQRAVEHIGGMAAIDQGAIA